MAFIGGIKKAAELTMGIKDEPAVIWYDFGENFVYVTRQVQRRITGNDVIRVCETYYHMRMDQIERACYRALVAHIDIAQNPASARQIAGKFRDYLERVGIDYGEESDENYIKNLNEYFCDKSWYHYISYDAIMNKLVMHSDDRANYYYGLGECIEYDPGLILRRIWIILSSVTIKTDLIKERMKGIANALEGL